MSGQRLYESPAVWEQALQPGQAALLRAIHDALPAGIASVLDVGCGDGKIARSLAARVGCELIGLDISTEALRRTGLPAVRASAAQLPFERGAFDLVMSTDMIEHLPDATEAAAWTEMFRVATQAVMVAVPFREVLEEAIARCARCGTDYHVNWHQRRYDFADLEARAAPGWRLDAFVLSGEPWSPVVRAEVLARRLILGERAGWEDAVCPHCGERGSAPARVSALTSPLAEAVAEVAYRGLAQARELRMHSELLAIYVPEAAASLAPAQAGGVVTCDAQHTQVAGAETLQDLVPYPQRARVVRTADQRICVQLPVYGPIDALQIELLPGVDTAQIRVEDGSGLLLDAQVDRTTAELRLPRAPASGYYGLLLRSDDATLQSVAVEPAMPLVEIQPGNGPHACAYARFDVRRVPVWVQALAPCWIDPAALVDAPLVPAAQVVADIARVLLDRAGRSALAPGSIDDGARARSEANAVRVQNLSAELEQLRVRIRDADRLAVDLQNAAAERDALRLRSAHADRIEVDLQNATAERDALRLRAREADALAVDVQNLVAERDALRAQRDEAQVKLAQQLTQAERLLGDVDALQQEIRRMVDEGDARVAALQAGNGLLEQEAAQLRTHAQALQTKLESMRRRLRFLGPQLSQRTMDWMTGE